MNFRKLSNISRFMPFSLLDVFNNHSVVPLLYHTVGDVNQLPYLKGLYKVPTPKRFEKDLDFILKNYKPIDLPNLIKYAREGILPSNKKFFFLSFDDGLKQCKDIIAPILKRKGVPATFFLNTSFIDNRAFLHRFKTVLMARKLEIDKRGILTQKAQEFCGKEFSEVNNLVVYVLGLRYPQKDVIEQLAFALELDLHTTLANFEPYMSKSDIEDLILEGHSIGAHSMDHPEFYLLSEKEQLEQASKSIEQLTSWFKLDYKVFAFPFTDSGLSKSFFQKLNLTCQPDLTFGCSGIKTDAIRTNIQRIAMDDSNLSAKNRLKAELLYYVFKWPLGKNTYKRK